MSAETKTCREGGDVHTDHLTWLAKLALRMPGMFAWRLVLRARLATRPCNAWRAS